LGFWRPVRAVVAVYTTAMAWLDDSLSVWHAVPKLLAQSAMHMHVLATSCTLFFLPFYHFAFSAVENQRACSLSLVGCTCSSEAWRRKVDLTAVWCREHLLAGCESKSKSNGV
jgi:hypothetical protein